MFKTNQNCAMVIHRCKDVLLKALQNDHDNAFDMLDPLVSDNQCHMHSLLLLNILRKCYRVEDFSFDLNRLNDYDIEILSLAAFLSHFKVATIDDFDFVVREVSLDNFCKAFDTKTAERRFIGSVKAKFNVESTRFIKSLATDEVKCIMEACSAYRLYSGHELQLLPHYPTLFPIFAYLKENDLPILVVLQRLERKSVATTAGLQYRLHSTEIMLFKLENGTYRLCDQPTQAEKFQPTIAFSWFSCIGYGPSDKNYLSKFRRFIDESTFPSRKFFRNCDITNLLMMSAAEYQLPSSPTLSIPDGYGNGKVYAEYLFKMNSVNSTTTTKCYDIESEFDLHSTNVYEKYIGHYNLALDCNSGDCSKYCEVVNGAVKRTDKNIFFAPVHVQVSNYKREYGKRKCVQRLLKQHETYHDINKDSATMEVLRKLKLEINF